MPAGGESSVDAWTAALLTPVAGVEHSGVYGRRPIADEPAEELAKLAMPVVAIFGSDDWIFTPSVRAFVAKLPNATLHMVAGGKHHLYRHLPTEFHALVGAAPAVASPRAATAEPAALDGGRRHVWWR